MLADRVDTRATLDSNTAAQISIQEAVNRFQNVPETEIVKLAQGSDPGAFTWIYYAYAPRLRGYFEARLHNPDPAEDLTQVLMCRIFDKLETYKPQGAVPFGAWVFKIARNELVSYVRRAALEQRLFVHANGGDLHSWEMKNPNNQRSNPPEKTVMDRSLMAEVNAEVEKLPPAQREVVLLRFASDQTVKETAGALGKTENNVKVLQHKGIAKLRRSPAVQNALRAEQ